MSFASTEWVKDLVHKVMYKAKDDNFFGGGASDPPVKICYFALHDESTPDIVTATRAGYYTLATFNWSNGVYPTVECNKEPIHSRQYAQKSGLPHCVVNTYFLEPGDIITSTHSDSHRLYPTAVFYTAYDIGEIIEIDSDCEGKHKALSGSTIIALNTSTSPVLSEVAGDHSYVTAGYSAAFSSSVSGEVDSGIPKDSYGGYLICSFEENLFTDDMLNTLSPVELVKF